MSNETIGMILSIVGMIVTVFSFQVKNKKTLLFYQTVGSSFYLVSYIFSNGGIAVYLNIVYVIRNIIYIFFDNQEGKKTILTAMVLCVIYIAIYVLFVIFANVTIEQKYYNILPLIGAIFGTIAVTNKNVNILRLWKLGDSFSWLSFNIIIGLGALGGIIGEVFNILSILVGVLRHKSKKE